MSCNGLWILQVLFSSVAMLSFAPPMRLSFSGIGMWPFEDRICACFYVAKENYSSMVTTPLFHRTRGPLSCWATSHTGLHLRALLSLPGQCELDLSAYRKLC